MNTTDPYATLRSAEAAGAWRDLEGPVQWSCNPSRYRIKPEGEA